MPMMSEPIGSGSEILVITAPADGSVVGQVHVDSKSEVERIAARLRAAQPEWEALGPRGRAVWMGRFREWLGDNKAAVEKLLVSETGKSGWDVRFEIPMVMDVANYYEKNAERFLASERPSAHALFAATKRLSVVYRPRALVGVISPWNFPVALAFMDTIPALLAGCAVLVKPSELTPLAATELARGWREDIGAPDVLAIVNGAAATGLAVVDAVDYIQFTGSARTGRMVMQRAAERLTPISLELGGKDAMIVLADAPLERAANAAVWGAMFNAGQACVSVERVYAEEPIYDEFVARVTEKVRALQQGSGEARFHVGAMVSDAQLAIVERHVDEALAKGARALTGGKRKNGAGHWFEPTVLVDVDHSMVCMREETFGPTLPIMKVRNVEEAVMWANASSYALSASVWSRNLVNARLIARRLECGAVNINDMAANLMTLAVPMGGWKESGIGARLGGKAGIRKFCQTQAIVESRLLMPLEPNWYAASPRMGRIVDALLRFFNNRGLRRLGIGRAE